MKATVKNADLYDGLDCGDPIRNLWAAEKNELPKWAARAFIITVTAARHAPRGGRQLIFSVRRNRCCLISATRWELTCNPSAPAQKN